MTAMALHTCYAVGYGSTVLGGVLRLDNPLAMDVHGEVTDGEITPRSVFLYGRRPTAKYSVRDVGAHLEQCGPSGIAVSDLTGGFKLYGQAIAAEGTRATSGGYSLTYSNGVLVPETLTVNHNTDAELSYTLSPQTQDGNGNSNAVLAFSSAVSLPTIASSSARYGLGPVTIGAYVFTEITGVSINFGYSIQSESADGEADPQVVYIQSWQPTITIRGKKLAYLGDSAIPLDGKAATQANTTIYLRKRLAGSQYELNASAVHIKLTAAGVAHVDNAISAAGNAPGETSVVLVCSYDGTNAPIVATLDSAVT